MTTSKIFNPNEHLIIPKWINEEFFRNVLEKDEPEHKAVIKFTPVAATASGENFASIMLRVYIDLKMQDDSLKTKTYIVKTTLDEEKGGKGIQELGFFEKEMNLYKIYLPAFEELYKTAGKDMHFGPKCLFTCQEAHRTTIVFEDLVAKGFRNIDRIKGLDKPHMQYVLEKLAEFHAASAVYAEQNGNYPSEFNGGYVQKNYLHIRLNSYRLNCESYKKAMTTWGMENSEKYIKFLPNEEEYFGLCQRSLDVDPNDFNVLNHGDFWSSNILFSYQPDNNIEQVLLLDFQVCQWGSPAQDLLFLITLSAAKNIRLKDFDWFIEIYHEYLTENLQLLKYKRPIPKLRDLHMALYKDINTFHAFFAVFHHLCSIQFPADKNSNLGFLLGNSEAVRTFWWRLITNPNYVEIVKDVYPFYCRRGIFRFSDFV